jgi:hypothetical protein
MNHTASDIIQLEKLQRKICRQIQGLPDRVANVATYSLLGVEPIAAVIDKLILIFFGSILQNKDTIEYRIIERQISMDKPNGKSFASLVYDKLRKYKLPDLMDLMKNPIEKTWCEFPKSGCCKFRNFKVDFVCFSSIQASSQ